MIVQLLTTSVPLLAIPPPLSLLMLPVSVDAVRFSPAPLCTKMPAPNVPGCPFAIVRFEIVVLTLPAISKMRKLPALRSTVNKFAPGPLIVRDLLINSSPLVRLIGLTTLGAKVIVSPPQALAIMKRSEPDPVSLLLVTSVLPQPGSWSACTS